PLPIDVVLGPHRLAAREREREGDREQRDAHALFPYHARTREREGASLNGASAAALHRASARSLPRGPRDRSGARSPAGARRAAQPRRRAAWLRRRAAARGLRAWAPRRPRVDRG